MILMRNLAAASVLAMALSAAAASAQDAAGDAVRRALDLDRVLGPNADPPSPPAQPTSRLAVPPLPPGWIAGQPYRQQPLFATVPVGGTTASGRVRGAPR